MRVPKLTIYQIVLAVISLLLVIACITATLICYKSLPDNIPTHMSVTGEIDSYGSKGNVFVILIVMFVMYVSMTLMLFIPKVIENPNTLSPLNPAFAPQIARETANILIECIFLCVVLFAYILLFMLLAKPMPVVPVWIISGLIVVSSIVRCIRLSKYKL